MIKHATILLLSGLLFVCCEKSDTDKNDTDKFFEGITFCSLLEGSVDTVIVKNDEIIGYNSIEYAFLLKNEAWQRLDDEITPMYPDPHFYFGVALNREVIYRADFIPYYYSQSYTDIITFWMESPNLVYITLGYPPSPEHFIGEDLRNDERLLNFLKQENKIFSLVN